MSPDVRLSLSFFPNCQLWATFLSVLLCWQLIFYRLHVRFGSVLNFICVLFRSFVDVSYFPFVDLLFLERVIGFTVHIFKAEYWILLIFKASFLNSDYLLVLCQDNCNSVNTFKYHVFAPMGRFQLELIYLYFPPS